MTLKNKWWHRLATALFVVTIITSSIAAILIVLEEEAPYVSNSKSTYHLVCKNFEKTILFDVKYSEFSNGRLLDQTGHEVTQTFCLDPKNYNEYLQFDDADNIEEYFDLYFSKQEKLIKPNYKFIISEPFYIGSWLDFGKALGLSLLFILIGATLLRYLYFYIVIGRHKFIFNEL